MTNRQRDGQLNFSGGVVSLVHQRRSTEAFFRISVADSLNMRPTEYGTLESRDYSQEIFNYTKATRLAGGFTKGRLLNHFHHVSALPNGANKSPYDKVGVNTPAIHALMSDDTDVHAQAMQVIPYSTPYPASVSHVTPPYRDRDFSGVTPFASSSTDLEKVKVAGGLLLYPNARPLTLYTGDVSFSGGETMSWVEAPIKVEPPEQTFDANAPAGTYGKGDKVKRYISPADITTDPNGAGWFTGDILDYNGFAGYQGFLSYAVNTTAWQELLTDITPPAGTTYTEGWYIFTALEDWDGKTYPNFEDPNGTTSNWEIQKDDNGDVTAAYNSVQAGQDFSDPALGNQFVAAAMHGGRRWVVRESEPDTLYASMLSAVEDKEHEVIFQKPAGYLPSDGLEFRFPELEKIYWIESIRDALIIGSRTGVYALDAQGGAITPTSFNFRRISTAIPAANPQPVVTKQQVTFLDASGERVVLLSFNLINGSWSERLLSWGIPDIIKTGRTGGVRRLAYAHSDGGTLAVLMDLNEFNTQLWLARLSEDGETASWYPVELGTGRQIHDIGSHTSEAGTGITYLDNTGNIGILGFDAFPTDNFIPPLFEASIEGDGWSIETPATVESIGSPPTHRVEFLPHDSGSTGTGVGTDPTQWDELVRIVEMHFELKGVNDSTVMDLDGEPLTELSDRTDRLNIYTGKPCGHSRGHRTKLTIVGDRPTLYAMSRLTTNGNN